MGFPICDPHVFQKSGSVTFEPIWYPNFMQKKKEKTKEQSLRYLKTDQRTDQGPRTTDGQGQLLRTPSGEPRVLE